MRREGFLLWFLAVFLLTAIVLTLLCAPRRSRHGYGSAGPSLPRPASFPV